MISAPIIDVAFPVPCVRTHRLLVYSGESDHAALLAIDTFEHKSKRSSKLPHCATLVPLASGRNGIHVSAELFAPLPVLFGDANYLVQSADECILERLK